MHRASSGPSRCTSLHPSCEGEAEQGTLESAPTSNDSGLELPGIGTHDSIPYKTQYTNDTSMSTRHELKHRAMECIFERGQT